MSRKKITVNRTCPACQGRGKSYGPRHCGRCNGRTTVRETAIVEDVDDVQRESLLGDEGSDAIRELRKGLVDALNEMDIGGRR